MQVIATIAGYPLTLGVVASFLVEAGKRTGLFDRVPLQDRTFILRCAVAVVSLGLNCLAVVLAHGKIDVSTLLPTLVSYATAAATYDHLLQ